MKSKRAIVSTYIIVSISIALIISAPSVAAIEGYFSPVIYPTLIDTGNPVTFEFCPSADAYGILFFMGPFDDDGYPMNEDDFHIDCLLLIEPALTKGIHYTIVYPSDSTYTWGGLGDLLDLLDIDYEEEDIPPSDPNTDIEGNYIASAAIIDTELVEEYMEEYEEENGFIVLIEELIDFIYSLMLGGDLILPPNTELVQIAVTNVHIIPEFLGTLVGIAIPCLTLAGMKIRKRKERNQNK